MVNYAFNINRLHGKSPYYVTAKNIQHKASEGTELYFLIGPDCVSTFGSKGPLSGPAFNFHFPYMRQSY